MRTEGNEPYIYRCMSCLSKDPQGRYAFPATSLAPSGAFLFPGPYQSGKPCLFVSHSPQTARMARDGQNRCSKVVFTLCCFPFSAMEFSVAMSSSSSLITFKFAAIPTYRQPGMRQRGKSGAHERE